MNNSQKNSSMDIAYDFDASTVPVFCFPEIIEKMPISLTYCFIYLIGTVLVVGYGFYLYYKKMMNHHQKNNNGYTNDKQYPETKPSDEAVLHRLLRSRPFPETSEVPVFIGDKS
jgi:hypothetical protein